MTAYTTVIANGTPNKFGASVFKMPITRQNVTILHCEIQRSHSQQKKSLVAAKKHGSEGIKLGLFFADKKSLPYVEHVDDGDRHHLVQLEAARSEQHLQVDGRRRGRVGRSSTVSRPHHRLRLVVAGRFRHRRRRHMFAVNRQRNALSTT